MCACRLGNLPRQAKNHTKLFHLAVEHDSFALTVNANTLTNEQTFDAAPSTPRLRHRASDTRAPPTQAPPHCAFDPRRRFKNASMNANENENNTSNKTRHAHARKRTRTRSTSTRIPPIVASIEDAELMHTLRLATRTATFLTARPRQEVFRLTLPVHDFQLARAQTRDFRLAGGQRPFLSGRYTDPTR